MICMFETQQWALFNFPFPFTSYCLGQSNRYTWPVEHNAFWSSIWMIKFCSKHLRNWNTYRPSAIEVCWIGVHNSFSPPTHSFCRDWRKLRYFLDQNSLLQHFYAIYFVLALYISHGNKRVLLSTGTSSGKATLVGPSTSTLAFGSFSSSTGLCLTGASFLVLDKMWSIFHAVWSRNGKLEILLSTFMIFLEPPSAWALWQSSLLWLSWPLSPWRP